MEKTDVVLLEEELAFMLRAKDKLPDTVATFGGEWRYEVTHNQYRFYRNVEDPRVLNLK